MTPKERFACALNLGVPDRVPTFELEFQLAPELLGKEYLHEADLKGLSEKEIDYKLRENAEYIVRVYEKLEHDAICLHHLDFEHLNRTAKYIKEMTNDHYMPLPSATAHLPSPTATAWKSWSMPSWTTPMAWPNRPRKCA